jgi:FtsP/CotA-like multicopper oxidase with cupredoxin domain
MRIFLSSLFLLFTAGAFGATHNLRLEIKSGQLAVAGGGSLDYHLYTSSAGFPQCSDLFIWELGDAVNLKVVNNLSAPHGFLLEGHADLGTILPGDSAEQQFNVAQLGVFRYYDPLNAPYNAYMGLHGLAHVKQPGDPIPYFYWEVREMQEDWNSTIPGGATPLLSAYSPKFFTINGNYSPNVNGDPIARVTGATGQEFRIVIVNNGLSMHSMHFHGYHLSVLDNSKFPSHVGRSKDTFPSYPGEHLVLSCVPDKGGEYPVHDHNLVAVTGNGMYPNGMFTTLLIAP